MSSTRHHFLRQLTCHFKQPGLKDGAPSWAPSLVVKIQRVCLSWCWDWRCGRSLTGYVRKGNLSNRRRIGCGVVNHGGEVSPACDLIDRLDFGRSSDVTSAFSGIAQVHVDANEFYYSPTNVYASALPIRLNGSSTYLL